MDQARIDCVGAVVVDPGGRLLLVRRGREPGRGLWSIPGGKVVPGETLEQAVRREVLEETALLVEVERHVGTVERPAPPRGTYVIHDFVARCLSEPGDLRAGDDADEAGWFDAARVRSMACVPGLLEALEEWRVLAPD